MFPLEPPWHAPCLGLRQSTFIFTTPGDHSNRPVTHGMVMGQHAAGELVAMEGDIVEIFERDGVRRARIVLRPQIVCEVRAEDFPDAHLGDRVVVRGHVTIEQVAVNPPPDFV